MIIVDCTVDDDHMIYCAGFDDDNVADDDVDNGSNAEHRTN